MTKEIADTEQQLKSLTKEYQNFGSVAGQELQTAGKKMQDVGDKISGAGTKMLPITGVVTAAGVAAVKTAADFDSGMSQVSAVSGATGSDLEALRDKAREMGEKAKFSASEAAEARADDRGIHRFSLLRQEWKTSGCPALGALFSECGQPLQ